ncbi:alpha-1,2-mannosyltransferase ALG9 [Folsomia candida]|uniref:Mannosyltransferase n=1 Tax=Folsomia candida TaxID=158441 RepID=A0A226E318_FOLCA|nr:alpha-1,2-mannosyltransferase ALG9 [Folsomia candida]XP_021955535.1 alpha-1,2-mannosyltransferase ALG9 [Folsomia candida]XP_021955536.1 alpha-1,2-mannosyltransferase ALG9 [Folsomia candida]XP_021955537.1 alpha-1,2-mannosyltransferase ALG9 [Folsomia candida]XP_035709319.1 alpha-1,2-mannosyltransferase ALG9 [Folsomia candida]XP_035709322.1 alpha-1,2-mannosyltransferase ALG9 [Folsomia candida]XP_035709323.1 alpha-1,2-mannosyltransferase ALG9 [Folsomia candida]XP_035709324.1 alpha-1,2-mannosy
MGGGSGSKSRHKGSSATKQPYVASKTPEDRSILDDIEGTGRKKKTLPPTVNRTANDDDADCDDFIRDPYWSPTPYSAFKLLISARFAAGLWTTISDCDETYNYWEPAHYLLYGKGFQTWEYSPVYALRSYTYILFHAVPAKIYDYVLRPTPLLIFFFVRCFLAFICACAEAYLYRSVRKKFGGNVARITLVTALFSAGMFISSCAFLPSAFSMYMTAFAFGAWLDGLDELAIFSVALSGLLSWPFAALTGVIIAVDILLIRRKLLLFIKWSVVSLLVILIPVIVLDSNMYGKPVIAPWNIVKYNILSNKGPELYGTEPWSFYFTNGTLNFNLVFASALISPFLMLANYKMESNLMKKMGIVGTIYVWLLVFVLQPHKEERFIFPVFALIPVAGALGIDAMQKIADLVCSKIFLWWIQRVKDIKKVKVFDYRKIVSSIGVAAILTSSVIGSSRILALYYGYRAPFDVYFAFNRDASTQRALATGKNYTVCYGKEWYRFPSSFFLPSLAWDVRFIESDFKGQLPDLYSPFDPAGTKRIPEHMNDWNREEPTRYVNISDCDYLVDLIDPDRFSAKEPNYAANTADWRILAEQDFLNSAKSHQFFRAFYVPWFSSQYTTYDSYVFMKRVRKKNARQKKRGKEFTEDDI